MTKKQALEDYVWCSFHGNIHHKDIEPDDYRCCEADHSKVWIQKSTYEEYFPSPSWNWEKEQSDRRKVLETVELGYIILEGMEDMTYDLSNYATTETECMDSLSYAKGLIEEIDATVTRIKENL